MSRRGKGEVEFPESAQELAHWVAHPAASREAREAWGLYWWVNVLDRASSMVFRADQVSGEDELYQKVFLDAVHRAVSDGAMSATEGATKEIVFRVALLNLKGFAGQARDAFRVFVENVPLSLESASDQADGWIERSLDEILMLRAIKNMLSPLKLAAEFLDGDDRQSIDAWLELLPRLP